MTHPPVDPVHLPRELAHVPIVSGPSKGIWARVPVEPDGLPVQEVVFSGVPYTLQKGARGCEYVVAG